MTRKYKCKGFTKLGQEYKYFTKGKIYNVVDEKITDDTGFQYTITKNDSVIEWLSEWYKFEEVGLEEFSTTSENYEIHITNKANKTYGVMKSNGDIIKRVETVKNPLDEFDFEVASEIIMDRLFNSVETLEVKEVKRKARVGEWVKIVNASYVPKTDGIQDYKNGDILQITEGDNFDGNYVRYGASNDSEKILFKYEYVVLENYTPTKQLSDYTNEELLAEIERRLK